jgi:hypothetical protein
MRIQSVHIGGKIKARAKELRIGPTELARQINTTKQNVYGIYKRESIDTELLMKLSKALRLDFFLYYNDPKLNITGEGGTRYIIKNRGHHEQAAEEVIALKRELAELREKFEFLKKLYEITAERKGSTPKKLVKTRRRK